MQKIFKKSKNIQKISLKQCKSFYSCCCYVGNPTKINNDDLYKITDEWAKLFLGIIYILRLFHVWRRQNKSYIFANDSNKCKSAVKPPRGLALGEQNNTVCSQENIITYSVHLAESLHNFFTNESFLWINLRPPFKFISDQRVNKTE